MIETPAAALISDELARYVDFFSIGTNDLTQYTMAADRMNVAVADYYQTTNPAVLKLMEMTIANAKKTLGKRIRLRRGSRRHRKCQDVCVYRHTKPFHGAECRIKRKITAY